MSTVADGVDFVAAPWLYPGPAAPGTGLLTRDGYHRARARADFGASTLRLAGTSRTVDGALRAAGVDGVRDRRLVVAVGSNACPAVVARKLTAGHVDPTVPFLRATVTGMAVGHSAHVSVAGYVAATAFRRPGARTAVFASLLDRDQLACLDATEPNYTRRAVTADECILAIDGGARPVGFDVYVSKWGTLAPPGGSPIPLQTQEALFGTLLRECAGFAALVGRRPHEYRSVMTELSGAADLRAALRRSFAASGWASRSGFGD
ncbi:hypothetical protein ACXN1G_17665 [Rhodococcus ruber]|uniref:hypothetical protein n=1 Tax=Rhodococcus TaxID=1827 RepID=UPI0006600FAA|nr:MULTISPECIES: hypothetical protein [Rhodococcus]MDO2378284.1 hypothetical protein [Rhodococcus ruber]UIR39230.1 hypothetical protein LZP97_12420 [Rhodococcus sp. DMF-1]